MIGSLLRIESRDARHKITQSRRWRLRNSLIQNQGLTKETASALAAEAVPHLRRRVRV